jgi:hypothetical protein
LAVEEKGTHFCFGCGGEDVTKDLGDGKDGAIAGRFGVGVFVSQIVMASSAAACFGLSEI